MSDTLWLILVAGAAIAAFTLGRVLGIRQASALLKKSPAPAPPAPTVSKPVEIPAEAQHAPGLFLLSMLQREGRLIDFTQEEISSYSDAEVGAAARVVHQGCRKVLQQYLAIEPVLADSEGASVSVPAGFDAQKIRLTGNVAGAPPFKGSLKHHGWTASQVKLPAMNAAIDPRILAPAEVELS
jgi:hypothetical protein